MFHQQLTSALEAGDLGPVDWAIEMIAMDEAIGVNARVFDGTECIDTFEGRHILQGLDTEAYLERFHGVVVDSAGPYLPSAPYDPSLSLATEQPDSVLADTTPEAPFDVTGDDYWVLAVAEAPASRDFEQWLVDELREAELLLDDSDSLVDRPWVTDGPTTVEYVQSKADTPTQVRAQIPLAYGGLTEEGLRLQFGIQDFDGPVDWVVFLYGDAAVEQVSAWVFVEDNQRFTFGDALDHIEGEPGANGADVAAYLERYYGFEIDPTPAGVRTPSSATVELTDKEPPERYTEVLEEHGVQHPAGEE